MTDRLDPFSPLLNTTGADADEALATAGVEAPLEVITPVPARALTAAMSKSAPKKGWDAADPVVDWADHRALRDMSSSPAKPFSLDPNCVIPGEADEEISEADLRTDLKEAEITQREALLQVCDVVKAWRSPEGEAFVSIPHGGHVEHHPVYSPAFRNWMLHGLATRFTQNGRPASAGDSAVREARSAVEARGLVEGSSYPVALRIAEHDAGVYLDLGTPDWSVVEVTADGWRIIPEAPVPILRGKRAGPFAAPVAGGKFGPLRRLLRHLDEDTFILLVAWCLGALLPRGPYPILILGGEHGAGKSTVARLVQRITDPGHGDLLQPPRDDRDLIAAAKANRVLSFDNLSGMRPDLADSMCRLATGSEIGGRALFTDHEMASFAACRPQVINGIPDLAARGDLADRSIVLRLPNLSVRMTERDWQAALGSVLPETFTALLNALSRGLKFLDATPTPNVRMADFARFIAAAEPALPWSPGDFVAAYERSRLDANAALADGDVVASAVRGFMGTQRRDWNGLVSNLYREVSTFVASQGQRAGDWPGNPRWFGDRLRRSAPTLRALGIEFQERRIASGRGVTLRRVAPIATLATLNTSDTSGALERDATATNDSGGANVARRSLLK